MANDQFKTFSINLNAEHVNGMTPFDLAVQLYGYYILESRSIVDQFVHLLKYFYSLCSTALF